MRIKAVKQLGISYTGGLEKTQTQPWVQEFFYYVPLDSPPGYYSTATALNAGRAAE